MPDFDAPALDSPPIATDLTAPRPLPHGWRWAQLGDVCDVIAGQSPTSDTYRNQPEGLPFFQGKADFGRVHPVARVWCTAPIKVAFVGDILISVRAPVGPTNVADVECCIGRGLAALRPQEVCDGDYLLFALKFAEPELAMLGSGSTFAAITTGQLASLAIPLPPLAEQRRIAAILAARMAEVERARAAAEAQLAAARALPAAELRAVFESEEAREWPRVRLGDIVREGSLNGLAPRPSDSPPGSPILRISAGTSRGDFLVEESDYKYLSVSDDLVARYALERGDLLAVRFNGNLRYVGRFSLYAQYAGITHIYPDKLIRFRLNYVLGLPEYVVLALNSARAREQIEAVCDTTAGNIGVSASELRNIEIPLPPIYDQRRIADQYATRMARITRLRAALEAQRDTINALPAALLRQAFNGEL